MLPRGVTERDLYDLDLEKSYKSVLDLDLKTFSPRQSRSRLPDSRMSRSRSSNFVHALDALKVFILDSSENALIFCMCVYACVTVMVYYIVYKAKLCFNIF